MQADPPAAPGGLRLRLADLALPDLLRPLGHLDRRLVPVEVDEAPAQPGQLAGPEPAHQPGQPHRRVGVAGDCLDQQRWACSMESDLRRLAGRAAGSRASAAGFVLIALSQAVLAGLFR